MNSKLVRAIFDVPTLNCSLVCETFRGRTSFLAVNERGTPSIAMEGVKIYTSTGGIGSISQSRFATPTDVLLGGWRLRIAGEPLPLEFRTVEEIAILAA